MAGISMQIQTLYMHTAMNKTMQARRTLRSDALEVIEACAGWNSRLASRRITQFLEKRMIGSGLTIAQFGLMAQIATASDDTLGALAERLGLDQSSLSRDRHRRTRFTEARGVAHREGRATAGRSNAGLASRTCGARRGS
jgi:hypothetical protein